MTGDVRKVDIHDVLERHQVRYEVRPYFVASFTQRTVPAGFDVDLYGTLEKMQLPLFQSDEGRRVVDYFQTVAQEIQSKAEGYRTTIEVMPASDSLVLDTQHHFRPQAMLKIRITHDRGLDQPAGPAEEQALKAIRETLHQLKVTES
jgi:hypothetical protein